MQGEIRWNQVDTQGASIAALLKAAQESMSKGFESASNAISNQEKAVQDRLLADAMTQRANGTSLGSIAGKNNLTATGLDKLYASDETLANIAKINADIEKINADTEHTTASTDNTRQQLLASQLTHEQNLDTWNNRNKALNYLNKLTPEQVSEIKRTGVVPDVTNPTEQYAIFSALGQTGKEAATSFGQQETIDNRNRQERVSQFFNNITNLSSADKSIALKNAYETAVNSGDSKFASLLVTTNPQLASQTFNQDVINSDATIKAREELLTKAPDGAYRPTDVSQFFPENTQNYNPNAFGNNVLTVNNKPFLQKTAEVVSKYNVSLPALTGYIEGETRGWKNEHTLVKPTPGNTPSATGIAQINNDTMAGLSKEMGIPWTPGMTPESDPRNDPVKAVEMLGYLMNKGKQVLTKEGLPISDANLIAYVKLGHKDGLDLIRNRDKGFDALSPTTQNALKVGGHLGDGKDLNSIFTRFDQNITNGQKRFGAFSQAIQGVQNTSDELQKRVSQASDLVSKYAGNTPQNYTKPVQGTNESADTFVQRVIADNARKQQQADTQFSRGLAGENPARLSKQERSKLDNAINTVTENKNNEANGANLVAAINTEKAKRGLIALPDNVLQDMENRFIRAAKSGVLGFDVPSEVASLTGNSNAELNERLRGYGELIQGKGKDNSGLTQFNIGDLNKLYTNIYQRSQETYKDKGITQAMAMDLAYHALSTTDQKGLNNFLNYIRSDTSNVPDSKIDALLKRIPNVDTLSRSDTTIGNINKVTEKVKEIRTKIELQKSYMNAKLNKQMAGNPEDNAKEIEYQQKLLTQLLFSNENLLPENFRKNNG